MSNHQQGGKFTGVIDDVEGHGRRGPLLEEDVEAHGFRGPLLEEDVEAHMPRVHRGLRWDVEDLTLLEGGRYNGAEGVVGLLSPARRVD